MLRFCIPISTSAGSFSSSSMLVLSSESKEPWAGQCLQIHFAFRKRGKKSICTRKCFRIGGNCQQSGCSLVVRIPRCGLGDLGSNPSSTLFFYFYWKVFMFFIIFNHRAARVLSWEKQGLRHTRDVQWKQPKRAKLETQTIIKVMKRSAARGFALKEKLQHNQQTFLR